MSFLDDLVDTGVNAADDAISNSQDDIGNFIKNRIIEPLVKVGPAPTGNLTAAQIAAGQTVQAAPVAPPASAVMSSKIMGISAPVLLLAAGVGAFLLFSKGRK